MDQRSTSDDRDGESVLPRRPYARPRLERYGTLGDLTQTTANKVTAASDGGSLPSMDKTR